MVFRKGVLIYFYPLFFLQIYLIVTLVIYQFGPVHYKTHEPVVFWLLMLCYLVAFIFGYSVAYKMRRKYFFVKHGIHEVGDNFKLYYFYVILILSFCASLVSFKGDTSIFEMLNPLFWMQGALNGVQNLGDAYNAKMERVSDASGNKLLNILLFFISFSKVIIIPLLVFLWDRLSLKMKVISFFLTLLPVMTSLSHGTNKGVFDAVIFYGTSVLVYFIYHKFHFSRYDFKKRRFFLRLVIIAFVGALITFGSSMSQRGGDLRYIESFGYHNEIKVTTEALSRQDNFVYYTYAWLSTYLVQGYYGFSLALDEEFDSTYGVGNSIFITRNVESLLGTTLSDRTFQRKIHDVWSETAQWHSFYSYFANDFHFVGVIFICFLIAFILARIWFSFLQDGNVFAGSMLPVLSVLIIFIPANNQIFGFLDGLSAFSISMYLWWLSNRRVGRKIFIRKQY